jgi:hypothetical protein
MQAYNIVAIVQLVKARPSVFTLENNSSYPKKRHQQDHCEAQPTKVRPGDLSPEPRNQYSKWRSSGVVTLLLEQSNHNTQP